MNLDLQGKVAVVTGGSRGIGLGIVQQLLAEGARVVNVNRSPPDAAVSDAESPDVASRLLFVQGDLTDVSVCERRVPQTIGTFRSLSIPVNYSGVTCGPGLRACPPAIFP